MKIFHYFVWLWAGVVPSISQAQANTVPISGQISFEFNSAQRNTSRPYATADTLKPGLLALPADVATLRTELRASANGLTGDISLQQQDGDANTRASSARVTELYASHDAGAWQFSAGKKIVAWDVGYGFRPNDMVQQEERRTLVSRTPEGRPMVVAEHFNANTAWSAVWVNPTASMAARGAQENAFAARVYQRNGAADWYGFARVGAHTGASVGVALAWVASESLELHSSVRHSNQVDSTAMDPNAVGLVASNPWQPSKVHNVNQWLVGGTWTNQSQLSLLAEAWWDGSAPCDAQWDSWTQRNQQLSAMAALGAPAAAVAGNLAWQVQGLGTSQNLRRRNVYLRLSWQNGAWQPALDVLYTPADQGRVVTASLIWQGDRVQVQGGLRAYGGPVDAVMVQLPSRQLAYVAMSWAF
jgi:hypothetical protein